MSGVEDEVLNISRHFSSALLRNRSVVRDALRECGGADGTYKLLNLVEYLLKLRSVRGSLEEITCHGNLELCIALLQFVLLINSGGRTLAEITLA